MSANETQVAGSHYRSSIQHWDYVVANDLDYFQAQITKYVTRWKKKNGLTDLRKAQHFLEKYLEVADQYLARQRHEVGKTVGSEGGGATGAAGLPIGAGFPDPVSGQPEAGSDAPPAHCLHPG